MATKIEAAPCFVTESAAMREVVRLAELFGRTNETVLIQGPTGVGKEGVARLVVGNSRRSTQSWAVINCAAISPELADSTFFGHEKGAFTGAQSTSRGFFAAYDGGTLVLDEIHALPLSMQAKLLRAIECGEIQPVGSDQIRKVDVRIIASSSRNLGELPETAFLPELFYRLQRLEINVLPLCERRDDIPALVKHFLGPDQNLSSEVMTLLVSGYDWPGNVRELENVVKRAKILADGSPIGLEHITEIQRQTIAVGDGDQLEKLGQILGVTDIWRSSWYQIVDALFHLLYAAHSKTWNQKKSCVARALGIERSTLDRWLKGQPGYHRKTNRHAA